MVEPSIWASASINLSLSVAAADDSRKATLPMSETTSTVVFLPLRVISNSHSTSLCSPQSTRIHALFTEPSTRNE